MAFSYKHLLSASFLVLVSISPTVLSGWCDSFQEICDSDEYCCASTNGCCTKCCDRPNKMIESLLGLLFFLFIFIFCPVMCYRCCCRRTVSRGVVYSPAGTTNPVAVTLPPQQQPGLHPQQAPYPQQMPYPQPAPYPTMVPYPQQTPYPPQDPNNPYYGAPPPAYGQVVAQDNFQASAPYLHS